MSYSCIDILPSNIWVTGLHSHFVKTNANSEIGFPKYPNEYFEYYASQAYHMARNAGLSAWGVTDYNFDPVRWAKSIHPKMDLEECTKKWESVAQKSAEDHTVNGSFLALSGFEYGKSVNYYDLSDQDKVLYRERQNYKGHIDGYGDLVIYNASFIPPLQGTQDIKNILELSEAYDYIVRNQAMGVFAHPKEFPMGKGNKFNNFELNKDAIESMVGFEIWNGASYFHHQHNFLKEFVSALQNGWKVGAMYNPDNFAQNWGSIKQGDHPLGFTIVIPSNSSSIKNNLTKDNLFLQLKRRKFYGSLSPKLFFGIRTEDGSTMGDTISLSKPTSLYIQTSGIEIKAVKIYQGHVEYIEHIEPEILSYQSDTTLVYQISPPLKGKAAFIFIELIGKDDKFIAHSSPIWVTRH